MPEWLYDAGPYGLWIFLLVTVVLGGLAAFATGRAFAQTWRPPWMILPAMLLLGAGVRFIHYAVFAERLLSPRNFVMDFVVLTVIAGVGYGLTRRRQMLQQYGWMSEAPTPQQSPEGGSG